MRLKRWLTVLASAFCAATALFLTVATGALARPAQPFAISGFSSQTIDGQSLEGTPEQITLNPTPYQYTQAGGHPWGLSTTVRFATITVDSNGHNAVVPARDPKDVIVDLPAGLLGNPNQTEFPRCPQVIALASQERCPADTQVGTIRLRWFGGLASLAPIVNMTPEPGQSAEFKLENDSNIGVYLTAHVVRHDGGYGLTVVSNNIPMTELAEVETVFWGVPADPSHDAMRGLVCNGVNGNGLINGCKGGGVRSGLPRVPFLTLPADCTAGPEQTTIRADSWQEPGRYVEAQAESPLPTILSGPAQGMTGCGALQFSPAIEVLPDTALADEPVGLGVNLLVPQSEDADTPATPQLRDSSVVLPRGLSISPGIVDGIEACEEAGPNGINFTGPESEQLGLNGEPVLAPGKCPDASIIGTAEAETPLLAAPVKGHVYLARPGCGGAGQSPCSAQNVSDGDLYQLYLELGGTGALANDGVNLKVRGKVEPDPTTGQLTTVFENTPQLPFSELRIRLNGGPRAPLDTPAECGPAVTTGEFTAWSAPGVDPAGVFQAGTPTASPSTFFDVRGCAEPTPLRPSFTAGDVTPGAGQFSSFTLDLSRQDREQYIRGIQVRTPPGLLGMLSSVSLCGEPQADAGSCPEASQIGTTRVASGAGSHPFEIDGDVYLTGPYGGAPFGLSIVTHVVAGPFNLGVVVVRAKIDVDPHTSTLTVTTDETGAYAIPRIVFGVPLRLQRVTVNIDRPNFMFNPTNCAAQKITAKISGFQGTISDVSSPFIVGACRGLAFKPRFTVSTSSHTSRAKGASLDTRLTYPKNALGNDANIASVRVELPKALPSRLSTLNHACPDSVFNQNPANCPPESRVGYARSVTPLLPVPVEGPAFFVSHGGQKFPELSVILQGDGVTVYLQGETFINKTGVTSTTFKTIPDVPVNTFELYLPQGNYSALAANQNLCSTRAKTRLVKRRATVRVHGRKVRRTITRRVKSAGLVMPTEFVGQNGAVFKQDTPITVEGCSARQKRRSRRAKRQKQGK